LTPQGNRSDSVLALPRFGPVKWGMKKISVIALVLFSFSTLPAWPSDRLPADEVPRVAEAWIASSVVFRSAAARLPAGQSFSVAGIQPIPAEGPVRAYGATLRPTGYVILAADRRLRPVIAFSTDRSLDLRDRPDNAFRALLLDDLAGSREALDGPGDKPPSQQLAIAANQAQWVRLQQLAANPDALQTLDFSGTNILTEPMLQTRWSQWRHYNYRCPPDPHPAPGYDGKAPAGCVSVAGAQVMRYHQWPPYGWGGHSYSDTDGSNLITGEHSAVFSDLIDWSNMQTSYYAYGSEPQDAVDAVSGLMYNLGTATEMNYGSFTNGGSVTSTETLRRGLATYYHYTVGYATNRAPNPASFDNAVRDEITNGVPTVVSTVSHALVADGYALEDAGHYYHLNYGWGGTDDGWYQFPNVQYGPLDSAEMQCRPRFMPLGMNTPSHTNTTGSYAAEWTFPQTRRSEVVYYRLYEGAYSPAGDVTYSGNSFDGWRNGGRWSSDSPGYGGTGTCFRCPSGELGNHTLTTSDPVIPQTAGRLSFQYETRLSADCFHVGISTNEGRTWNRVLEKTQTGFGGGWFGANVDLSPYSGRQTYVRFAYSLRSGQTYYPGGGAWIDNVSFSNCSCLGWNVLADNIASNVYSHSVTGRVDGTYYYAARAHNGTSWGEQSPYWSVSVSLDPALDVDGDRIPNGWETLYYGSATGAVAHLDTDGDGRDAWSEWWTGTHPHDPNSVFRVVDSQTTPSGQRLTWPAVSGRTYNVWQRTGLLQGEFDTLVVTGVRANASVHSQLIPWPPGNTNAYYRVGAVK